MLEPNEEEEIDKATIKEHLKLSSSFQYGLLKKICMRIFSDNLFDLGLIMTQRMRFLYDEKIVALCPTALQLHETNTLRTMRQIQME